MILTQCTIIANIPCYVIKLEKKKDKMMDEQKIIVTLAGSDKIGIVAALTAALAKYDVNIEDIKQTIMQDYFVMFLLAYIGKSKYSFKEIKDGLMEVADELKMELWVQKKQIFDKMHTI